MKTIAALLLSLTATAQTVTVNYPTNMIQQGDTSTPWTGAYTDCQQTIAIQYSPLHLKTWSSRCVGSNPGAGEDAYWDAGSYLPFVLIGTGYYWFPWSGLGFVDTWDVTYFDMVNPYDASAATSFGTTSLQRPPWASLGHETIDDYRFVVPAWSSLLSGTTWVVQFAGLHGDSGQWTYSSGVSIVYS